jgi:membrane protease YdiL (CAAX protease family)
LNSISEEQDFTIQKHCSQCNEPITAESRFCRHCGSAQNNDAVQASEQKWNNVQQIALFFIFDAVICAIASFIHFFKTVTWSICFDVLLAIIAVAFFCDNWTQNKSLLIWRNFSLLRLLTYCTLAVAGSLVVSFVVGWLNQTLFSKEMSYYAFYATHSYGEELMIFFVAAMPALFEELGYRGFLLQKLLLTVDKKQAIFISAFLFAIMHMSFISLFWLIPFALLLAYVRIKENTLWYGVCIHFTFNFTVCVMELHKIHHLR